MIKKLVGPARGFAIAIVILLALGGLFYLYTQEALSQEQQDEVLIKAIPFVAVFVSIILVYIFVIVAAALVLNGRVPLRTYRPIELLIIGGILLGIVGLFQGWRLFAYEMGFLLALLATLSFILWSHVTPMARRASQQLPPLSRRAHLIGLAAGAVIWAGVAGWLIIDANPQEPYGINPQIWDLMMDDEERVAAADDAENEYTTRQIPVYLLISLMPGALVYLGTRELAAGDAGRAPAAPATGAINEPPDGLTIGGGA